MFSNKINIDSLLNLLLKSVITGLANFLMTIIKIIFYINFISDVIIIKFSKTNFSKTNSSKTNSSETNSSETNSSETNSSEINSSKKP